MNDVAIGLHLLGSLGFVLVSGAVGLRLVSLARRSGERPELYLGLGILGTAVLGYGLLISAITLRGDPLAPVVTPATVGLTALGKLFHNAGVTMILVFVLTVFRPRERGARLLFAAALLVLWGGMVGVGVTDGYRDPLVKNVWWWCEYAVIWTYPLWPAYESFRYWGRMRRRTRLGLADPLTTNRFLLWGLCSLGTFLAVAATSFPMLLSDPADMVAIQAESYLLTSTVGIATVTAYYLTFFPPAWYRSWISAPPAGEPQAA